MYDLLSSYLEVNRRITSPTTVKVYRLSVRQLGDAIGRKPTLDDLTDASLVALEKHLRGRSPYTINERTGRIKALWRWAALQGIVAKGPTLQRLPVHDPYRRAWDVGDMRALLQAAKKMGKHRAFSGVYGGVPAPDWWTAYILTQYETGERTGALLACRWDWLTGDLLEIPPQVRKGRKAATYRLSRTALDQLNVISVPKRPTIFVWDRYPTTFFKHFDRLLKFAGLPRGRKNKGQRLRRTHLTHWAKGGGDPTLRAQHTSSGVTQRYYLDDTLLECPDPYKYLPQITLKDHPD